jgi:hypothetical protein
MLAAVVVLLGSAPLAAVAPLVAAVPPVAAVLLVPAAARLVRVVPVPVPQEQQLLHLEAPALAQVPRDLLLNPLSLRLPRVAVESAVRLRLQCRSF